jgi:hypothetical protein
MDITEKIDMLTENQILPSQGWLRKELGKGLKGVDDIVFSMTMGLYHYFDPQIVKKGGVVFKTQSSNKLSDELWSRLGKKIKSSEHMDDTGYKKLKKNFYNVMAKYSGLYKQTTSHQKSRTAWEFES